MAEFLVVVTGTEHPTDFYKNCILPKRGDVIDVKEDGARWGKKELSDPRWRVVRVPGMTVSEASQWLAREPMTSKLSESTLQYRAFKLDVDALALADPEFAEFLGGKDADQVHEAKMSLAVILDAKVRRPRIDDPAVIGEDLNVIG